MTLLNGRLLVASGCDGFIEWKVLSLLILDGGRIYWNILNLLSSGVFLLKECSKPPLVFLFNVTF